MNVVSICISEMENVETHINKVLTNGVANQLPLSNVTVNLNNITFEFGEFGDVWTTVVAKQYSKKDIANRTMRKAVDEFVQKNEGFILKRIIKKGDFWLVIFVKDNHR